MPAIRMPTARSTIPFIQPPLIDSSFKLDLSGIAGFFGGGSAWKALAATYILDWATPSSVLLGVYNSPGAYEVVKRCAPITKSTFWDGIFPADKQDAAEILGLEGKCGPPFLRTSGETDRTRTPAYLVARKAQWPRHASPFPPFSIVHIFPITIVDLIPKPSPKPSPYAGLSGWWRATLQLAPPLGWPRDNEHLLVLFSCGGSLHVGAL